MLLEGGSLHLNFDNKIKIATNNSLQNGIPPIKKREHAERYPDGYNAFREYCYNEYNAGILEIANSLLKILSNQLVDKTMVAAVKEK
jgi:hypothetical protein